MLKLLLPELGSIWKAWFCGKVARESCWLVCRSSRRPFFFESGFCICFLDSRGPADAAWGASSCVWVAACTWCPMGVAWGCVGAMGWWCWLQGTWQWWPGWTVAPTAWLQDAGTVPSTVGFADTNCWVDVPGMADTVVGTTVVVVKVSLELALGHAVSG